jgi:hypothetical protein
MKNLINGWEKKIELALKVGKGKYGKYTFVGDLFNYKKIIKLMRANEIEKAARLAYDLDTGARDEIPTTIWRVLDKAYYADD